MIYINQRLRAEFKETRRRFVRTGTNKQPVHVYLSDSLRICTHRVNKALLDGRTRKDTTTVLTVSGGTTT